MSEYIVSVPDEQAEQFIAKFGIEGTQIFGFQLTGEIVRCGDCRNYEYREHLGRSYCCGEYPTEPDGFCAWGELKEGGA